MALNKQRLKGRIKVALNEQAEESNADLALDRISEALAACIIDEIKELKITYTAGLTSPSGAVTGTFNANIT